MLLVSNFYRHFLQRSEAQSKSIQDTVLTSKLRGAHYYFDILKQNSIEQSDLGSEDALLIPQGPITLMSVFKKVWPDAIRFSFALHYLGPKLAILTSQISVFMVFWVTLMLFPGFTVQIPNYDSALGIGRLPTILIVRLLSAPNTIQILISSFCSRSSNLVISLADSCLSSLSLSPENSC